jgi:hypothetical protein
MTPRAVLNIFMHRNMFRNCHSYLYALFVSLLDVSEVACAPGTEIAVRNLFYNTPARFKFVTASIGRDNRWRIAALALSLPNS